MDIGMFVHKHITSGIILLSCKQFLGVSYHIEARIYPFRAEDEVAVIRDYYLLDALAQSDLSLFCT